MKTSVVFAFCVAALTSACVPAGPPPAFYSAAVAKPDAPHGALIRYEPLPSSPTGARAFRIIYQSTMADGRLIPVSGMAAAARTESSTARPSLPPSRNGCTVPAPRPG